MRRLFQTIAFAATLVACGDDIAGPKAPSLTSTVLKASVLLSKPVVARDDTMRFSYTMENLTAATLTLTTTTGCQVLPELDQVGGKRMSPPALSDAIFCPTDPTIQTLVAGEKRTFSFLLRGYDPSKLVTDQRPGYLLTTGTHDASVLITAAELCVGTGSGCVGTLRSDWVRFEVK